MEGTHGELRSRFANRLRRDDSRRLAEVDQASRSQVASITHHANAALRFASEHRANLYPLDASSLNRPCQIFRDLVIDINDDLTLVVFNLLKRHTTDDTIAQRFDNLARFDDAGDENSVDRAAIVFADDHVLRHVN